MRMIVGAIFCCCVVWLSVGVVRASEQFNLAIVYDEDEGIFGVENKAIAADMLSLFHAQAAPILFPGNLAMRIGLLSATPAVIPSDEDMSERRSLDAVHESVAALSEATDKKTAKKELCDTVKWYIASLEQSFALAGVFEKKTRELSLNQLVRKINVLSEYVTLSKTLDCKDVDSFFDLYRTQWAKNDISLRDWHVYQVKNSPQHLTLFIPDSYARAHHVDVESDIKKLGFNPENLEKITIETLAEKSIDYTFDAEHIADSIQRIFAPVSEAAWNIFIIGHGTSLEAGKLPIHTLLKKHQEPIAVSLGESAEDGTIKVSLRGQPTYVKTSSHIAGMPGHEFLRLLDFFTHLPTNIVVYNTCFGGGAHAEAIQQLFNLLVTLARPGASDVHVPVVVSVAGSEQATWNDEYDYKKFFAGIQAAFANSAFTQKQQEEIIRHAMQLIILKTDTPIILFPWQPKTGEREATATVAKTAEDVSKGLFTYLVNPTYRITTTSDGQLVLYKGSALVEHVPAEKEFVFKQPLRGKAHIMLETAVIAQPLVFKTGWLHSQQVPNLDIKADSDHVSFSSIDAQPFELADFLTDAFSQHGRQTLVTIDSLMALHNKKNISDALPKGLVTINNIALFTLGPYTDDRGYILFEHEHNWYLFNIVADKGNAIVLQQRATGRITADFGAFRAHVIEQCKANGRLIYALQNADITAIVHWFDQPMLVSALVPTASFEWLFGRLITDNYLWQHKRPLFLEMYSFMTPEQKHNMDTLFTLMGPRIVAYLLLIGIPPSGPFDAKTVAQVWQNVFLADEYAVYDSAINLLTDEQKGVLLTAVLAQDDPDRHLAAMLLVYGARPEPSISSETLMQLLEFVEIDQRAKAITRLTDEQKTAVLATIVAQDEPDKYLAAKLLGHGARLATTVSGDQLLLLFSGLDKQDYPAALTQLSSTQRTGLLAKALAENKWVAGYLLENGVAPDPTAPIDQLVGVVLQDLYDPDFSALVRALSSEQLAYVLSTLLASGDMIHAAKLLPHVIPDKAISAAHLVKMLDYLDDKERVQALGRLTKEQQTQMLMQALADNRTLIASALLNAGIRPSGEIQSVKLARALKESTLKPEDVEAILADLSKDQRGEVRKFLAILK
jgi:hypothetical protein